MTCDADAPDPATCTDMVDVRRGVDVTDAKLVALLGERFAYMDAAARIKTERQAVRDERRKAEVLSNVASKAHALGLDPVGIRALWDMLVEQSIAYELEQWDRLRRR